MDCYGELSDGAPLPGTEVVDVWLEFPLKSEKVRGHEAEMIKLLKKWPSSYLGNPVPALGKDISYLIAGAVLGEQQWAFMLFAFGKLLGWWDILEPSSMLELEKSDPLAQQIAGLGYVSISGYKPADTTR
jgi:hypothetical protein